MSGISVLKLVMVIESIVEYKQLIVNRCCVDHI